MTTTPCALSIYLCVHRAGRLYRSHLTLYRRIGADDQRRSARLVPCVLEGLQQPQPGNRLDRFAKTHHVCEHDAPVAAQATLLERSADFGRILHGPRRPCRRETNDRSDGGRLVREEVEPEADCIQENL